MKEEDAIGKGIDLETLKQEQIKLSKSLELEDKIDFKLANRFLGIEIDLIEKTKELLVSGVLIDEDFEVLEEKYAVSKPRFPYIPGFRAYRELSAIGIVLSKFEERPDVIFILAQGIAHKRHFGLASHLSLTIGIPVVGINKNLKGEEKGDFVYINGKKVAQKVITKQGSKEIYVSPGNFISLKTSVELTKRLIKKPHKLPEPLVLARRYADRVKKELF